MKKALIRSLVAAAAAAALAACNGQNYDNVYNQPTAGPSCFIPPNFTMMYPLNQSSVPASTTIVYISTTQTTIPGNYNTVVQPPNGQPTFTGGTFYQVSESQIPKPHGTPAAGALFYASNIGGLVAGETYQVGFNNLGTNCTPSLITTFTVL